MTGKTLRQLFKALNQWNNLKECMGEFDETLKLSIYIDDCKFYEGTSYMEFYNLLKEEYIEEFVSESLNRFFCGNNVAVFECKGTKHSIEIYVVC